MTAPSDESNVVPFPDDDIIPLVTGVTLIDAEAHVLARRLRPEPWEARARFFNNIIGGSLENMVKLSEVQFEEGDEARQREFWDMCMLTMHVRIAETLEYWEAETPWDRHAARLPCLRMFHIH